ncbi:hypothetical protein VARIO8X_60140 [Burkholderiales bacterium 8X]|nr:hypothetical protein VARIO8X_60140 [Burkholderiales bacterium 8X]
MDRPLQHPLSRGPGRPVVLAGAFDRLHHGDRGDLRLGSHHRAGEPVHGRVPDPLGSHDRHLLGARWPAVLRVLRGHADPDVPHHRDLGRAEQDLRGVQVLLVHAPRLAPDAGRADLPVQQVRRQLRHPDLAQTAARLERADLPLLRLLRGFRGQGADVAGTHLAARRTRRGADRRLGGAGGHHAEARRLRLPSLLDADRAGCLARVGLAHDRPVADRRHLRRPGGAGPAGHEEAGGVFVGRAHGLRHARLLHLQRPRHGGRHRADDCPRLRVGRHVPRHRRAVRPRAFAADRGLRRRGEHHAQVRRLRAAVRHGQLRLARHRRLRRRVDGDPRCGQGQLLARLRRRHGVDLRCRLHAVDVQARLPRAGRQPPRPGTQGHQCPRVPDAGAAGGGRALHGHPSEAIYRRDERVGGRTAAPCLGVQDSMITAPQHATESTRPNALPAPQGAGRYR